MNNEKNLQRAQHAVDTAMATVDARLYPRGGLDVLSRNEVARLRDASAGGMHDLLRRCALAVLTSGSSGDDPRAAQELYPDFDIQVEQHDRGLRIDLHHAPAMAFVDGTIIRGVSELLFAVVRDLAYTAIELGSDGEGDGDFDAARDAAHDDTRDGSAAGRDLNTSEGITDAVFGLLRNARILKPVAPNLAVCWGGHSIDREEYDYTKEVGYQLGLRGLDICTGCGPGAMKGPMKGATIAHAKQRRRNNRYIGVTEPGIIAAESPNPIVNHLVILPDIEKRLEAFVRIGHGFVVFPGGVGTAEEILYLLGILLREENAQLPFPLVFTGPARAAPYFEQIDKFIRLALGDAAASRYQIIIDDPQAAARSIAAGIGKVREHRIAVRDSFYFNWALHIPLAFQQRFVPMHKAMAELQLHPGREPHDLAADLRRAFSGIVAGNVKEAGIRRIEQHGPFDINGDPAIMASLDDLLRSFIDQRRMKIAGDYKPCYRIQP